jgi:hypothetical protein
MQYATMSLFLVLTACSAYTYDGRGNLVPYGGTTSTRSTATTFNSDNCGTPDEPKRCPQATPRPRRPAPYQAGSAPTPDYN